MPTLRGPLVITTFALTLALAGMASPVAGQLASEDPFPGPAAVQDRLDTFAEHPWVTIHRVGTSVEDRPIRVAEVVDPNGTLPADERPVTLLLTQQHGDEPAGTPAALRLLANITEGNEQAGWLSNQVLLVLPMVNPDGAAAGTRGNANGVDVNRDHIALDTPEARAVHEVLNRWDVDVANDHHEYGGTGAGNPVPARVYDYDITTLYPVHGNVRAPTVTVAQELMYEGIWPEAREAGYSINEYGELTAGGEPVRKISGGPDPGILRNHLGLHNIAGLLVETRIDAHPNPFHPPERRIQANTVVMEATLSYVHEHAQRFVDARNASQQLAVDLPARTYVEGDNVGPLARAYELPDSQELRSTMQRHEIDPGRTTDDGLVHDTWHPLQGHAAAMFHPNSTRALVTGTPTELPEAPEQPLEAASNPQNGTPLGVGLVLASISLAVFARRRA